MERITVKHYKSVFTKGDFHIGIYLCLNGTSKEFVTCKGVGIPTNNNTFYLFEGESSVENGKRVFNVTSFEMALAMSNTGLKAFFRSDEFAGVGKTVINTMVDTYGVEIFKIIENNPVQLLSIEGMDRNKYETIVNGYQQITSLKELTKKLGPMGLTSKQISLLNDAYGYSAMDIIEQNPFDLMETKGIGFKTCDTIARYLKLSLDSPDRIAGGVLEALGEFSNIGDTYAIDADLIDAAYEKLNDGISKEVVNKQAIVDTIFSLIKSHDIINKGHKMFLAKYYEAERYIASKLLEMQSIGVKKKNKLKSIVDFLNITLSDKQKEAVIQSLTNRVSVITGGAGTGKTTVSNAIISAYKAIFPETDIVLLAPTGKAARRITEVTGMSAHTIHSRLGLFEGTTTPQTTINSGLIIVDETSMVDTLLMEMLLRSIDKNCHLIFLGDINQLPSVSAGCCLKDIIESETLPVSKLTEVFRTEGESIVSNSINVIKGSSNFKYDDDTIHAVVSNEEEAISMIKRAYQYYANREGHENVALITPLRGTQNGRFRCVSDELNNIIQDLMNPQAVSCTSGATSYREGDKVMMWKNTQDASNGDIGIITNIDNDNEDWGMEMTVEWENGSVAKYHKQDLKNITLGYAMTVHKSQGSEYKTVIIPVLSSQKCRLFKTNLLYTALTRAKKRVVLVEDCLSGKSAIEMMVKNSDTDARNTGLKNQLIKQRERSII